ncbi:MULTISPECIES: flavin reductase [unclassified Streptomyces]|uniref:flavin reductase family protein n=1 Tax=unclassified Streptomyces TaxID=2593676 RepID=UPI0021B0EB69|nr:MULTISPECIES: flavin reductase [unclassified Streptomyces]
MPSAPGTRHPASGIRHPYFTCGPTPGCPRRADGCLSGPLRRSTTGIDRFDHPAIGHDDGLTSVADAVAWLECRMVDRVPAGDHHIVLAALVGGGHGGRDQSRPLLYHDRRTPWSRSRRRGRSREEAGPAAAGRPGAWLSINLGSPCCAALGAA